MSRAIDMIREGSALLNTEIVTLVRSGQTMNTEDSVEGNKPVTKRHILFDSKHAMCLKSSNSENRM